MMMLPRAGLLLIFLVKFCQAGPRIPESEWKPLDEYVWRPDDTYKWAEFREDRIEGEGDTVYFLNLTSQTWMSNEFSNWPVWWHYMVVVVPDNVTYTDTALLFIGGGNNNLDNVPVPENDVITEAVRLFAYDVGAICVYLKNVPNQPIVFNDDPEGKRLTEDAQIAFTWRKFIDNPETTLPEIVSRFPMTKAVVKAMDATTELLNQETEFTDINRYVVGGPSKRGWTTWTIAAVDDRVIGQAPMVMSLLNITPNVKKHVRSLGGWSFAFRDYYRQNLTLEVDNPNSQKLWDIVDPYSYIDRYTMPTMVISGTSDQFFLLDDSFFFFDKIPGQKMMYMMPGVDHSMAPWVDLYTNMRPFFAGVATGYDFPQPTWDIEYDTFGCTVTLRCDTNIPYEVSAYYAVTEDGTRRDFRLNRAGGVVQDITWDVDNDVETVESGVYRIRYDNPDPGTGWLGFFLEATYEGPGGFPFSLTTEVAITPNTYPFEECQGEGCYGTLV